MTTSNTCILIVIIAYLCLVVYVGLKYSKTNASSSDFYLGGRKLGPYVTAMSAEASDMSSYLLMGLPGLAYLSGLADVGWTIIGLAIGTYLNWLFTARRLRRYSQIIGAFTVPQFFSKRFHDDKNILSLIAAIVIIVFFVPYTASGFAACGKLFNSLFGLNYMTGMIIAAIVIIFYTTAGGFLAASTTDFIQSIVMSIALLFVVIFATITAGGIGAVVENAKALPGFFSMFTSYSEDTGTSTPYTFLTIIATLSWGFGYFGMPHILLRFMAIEDEEKLHVSRRVASVWVVIAMGVAMAIGVIGRTLSANGTIETLTGSGTENIIVKIADYIAGFGILPALMAGLVLAGILASTMSTADSQLLAASSSVSEDLLKGFFHVNISEKQSMFFARAVVVVIAVLGIFIAQDPDSSVFGIVSFAWAGFGAAFGPIIILALYWKRTTVQGAIAGMAAGGISVFVWKYGLRPLGGAWDIYELLPAFFINLIVAVVVSLLTREPDASVSEEFDLAASDLKLTK